MTTASASTRTSPSGSWGEQGTGTVPPAAGLHGVSSPAVGGIPYRCSPTGDMPYGERMPDASPRDLLPPLTLQIRVPQGPSTLSHSRASS